ncbi:hypothetical protein [Catellatospora chokoriensis]|uniref:Uncharacterized protein n=1 Tax=Catellatospora chokoriensis TaxID=310353 RepID=A0A8J3JPA9_9ACTN|nr:hypothetical protein [Catellatospora chokoriensis]GIF88626.1 hypothetical protein Cch02nite_20700 [Catellatospora chokoriensis]
MPERRMPAQITVDLAGLREIRTDLRRDTDEALRPGLTTAKRQMGWGARFCMALECAEGLAARSSVTDVLNRHHENAEYQLRIAESLTIALERIVENYADADARAAARITEIEAELNRAITQLENAARIQQRPSAPLRGMLP